MASSFQKATSDGTMALLDISIDYLDRTEIYVFFDEVLTAAWTWSGDTDNRILFNVPVPNGVEVLVRRTTDSTELRHAFSLGAAFTKEALDEDLKQSLHIAQEVLEADNIALTGDFFANVDMHGFKMVNVGNGVNPSDTANFGQVSALATTVANYIASIAASAGSTLMGWIQAGVGAVQRTVQDKLRDEVNVLDYGAAPSPANTTAAFQAAITANPGKRIRVPRGLWLVDGLDLRGWYGVLEGHSWETEIRARVAVTNLIRIDDAADVIFSPFQIRNIKLNGNNLATNVVNVRFRHSFKMSDVLIQTAVSGLVEKDTWLGRHDNVRIVDCDYGMDLIGSNHSSTFVSCTVTGCRIKHVRIQKLGTALDGNDAITMVGLDTEFGVGTSDGIDFDGTSLALVGSYTGEQMPGTSLIVRNGVVSQTGGVHYFGQNALNYGVDLYGTGRLIQRELPVNSHGVLGIAGYARGFGGKFSMKNVNAQMSVGGNPVFVGRPLDYGNIKSFCNSYGRNFSSANFGGATSTQTITGNAQRFLCTGAGSIMGANVALVDTANWQQGGKMGIIVEYKSTKAIELRLSATAGGGAPTTGSIGTLPATAGADMTYVKLDLTVPTTAVAILELLMNGPTTAGTPDEFTVYVSRCYDEAGLAPGAGVVGNLSI